MLGVEMENQSASFFNKMQCLPPDVATLGPLWAQLGATPGLPPPGAMGMPAAAAAAAAFHAATAGQRAEAQQSELHEIKARLGVLLELAARQAEQHEAMRKQLEEQAKYTSTTMQAVRQVQSQVNAMRTDFIDVFRSAGIGGGYGGHHAFDFESQVRRRFEARRGDSATPINAPMQGGKSSQTSRTESPEAAVRPPPFDSTLSPPRCVAAPGAEERSGSNASSRNGSERGSSAKCLDEDALQVRTPSEFGFNRSPPGLSLYPEETADEAWISEVANEIKNFIISDDERYLEAVRHAKPQVLNKTDHDGMTVFHYAAMHGRANACHAILKHDGFTAIKAGDRNSNTAMHIATLHDRGDVCYAILSHDASVATVVNRFGDSPAEIAQRRGDSRVCGAFQHFQI